MMMTSAAIAQDWPFVSGDYWEVTGIDISDGAGLKYANWLASEWRKNLEFSKSKGWIKSYQVLANVHNRSDEPDIYLIRVMENIASGPESEKRQKEYMDWQTKTVEQMQGESGNRAAYRTVMSTSLLQELNFRE
jgi:asparagine synthetase A